MLECPAADNSWIVQICIGVNKNMDISHKYLDLQLNTKINTLYRALDSLSLRRARYTRLGRQFKHSTERLKWALLKVRPRLF
jgi:hypothetical protein